MLLVVFKTDNHHSNSSRELLGVATTKNQLLEMVKKVAEQEELEVTQEQELYLRRNLQTYGYGFGEFVAEEVTPNELI